MQIKYFHYKIFYVEDALLQTASAILRLARGIRAVLDNPLEEALKLDFTELMALRLIEEGIPSPTELSKEMQVPAPTISRILNRLVELGLVERSVDSANLRRFQLGLTEGGRQARAKTRKIVAQVLREHYGHIPEGVLSAALASLAALEPYLKEARYA
ncbi:MAG: MarR family transcriptional regulator [Meiothermus sp.]